MESESDRLLAMYSTLDEALLELERRRNNPELCKKVEEFFGSDMFEPMKGDPKLVFSRHIVSPNFEFEVLWDMVKDIPMELLLFEGSTKFVPQNVEKYYLARLSFLDRAQALKASLSHFSNQPSLINRTLFDFNSVHNVPMHDIVCKNGQTLVNVHHNALETVYPDVKNKARYIDYLPWLLETKDKIAQHYIHSLSLFIVNGIYFDNFDIKDQEEEYLMLHQMFPSFEWVYNHFGVKPLVVPIVPPELASQKLWFWYCSDIIDSYGSSV